MNWVRNIAVLAVACLFATMWGIVLREKLAPPPGTTVKPNYDGILKPDERRREFLMGLYSGETRRGQTHTVIERDEEGIIHVQNQTRLEFAELRKYVFPGAGSLDVEFDADISPLLGLQSIQVNSNALSLRLNGIVREGRLTVRGTIADQPVSTELQMAQDPFVSSAFCPTTGMPDLKRVKTGDAWTLHVVNPLTGSVDAVHVDVTGDFRVEAGGQPVRVLRLLFTVGSRMWSSWVTEDGDVLAQGTPFGLLLRREDLPPDLEAALRQELPGPHQPPKK